MVTQYNTVTVLVAKVYSSLRKKKKIFFSFVLKVIFHFYLEKALKKKKSYLCVCDWCECVYECACYHNTFHVHLSPGNIVVLSRIDEIEDL